MESKDRITSLNISVAHITSTMLLPIVWILIGILVKWLYIPSETTLDQITSYVYYILLIGSYYIGLKYSFRYLTNNFIITNPKTSAYISIFVFSLGVILIYLSFYFYAKEHNYLRMFSFFIISYLFIIMTNKFFSILEPNKKCNEYSIPLQIFITIINLSLFIMLSALGIMFVQGYPWSEILLLIVVFLWVKDFGKSINEFLFIPYFYKNEKSEIYKKSILILALTIPINSFLYYLISLGT